MPRNTDAVNEAVEQFRAYLETLTFLHIDPRLRSKFGLSDVVQDTLLEALSHLDARQREALILQKYPGWTLAQIAEHMGCTVGVVAGLHARALARLREILPDRE